MDCRLKPYIILAVLLILHCSNMKSYQCDEDSDEVTTTRCRKDDPTTTSTTAPPPPPNPFKYRGCYRDHGKRMFKTHINLRRDATKENCVNYCRTEGFVYAGLQMKKHCFCGNTFPKSPKYPELEERKCDKPCKGNKSQTCGGRWANSVYETGVKSKD